MASATPLVASEVAFFAFDGSTNDSAANSYDADFQILNVSSDPSEATYVAGDSDQALHLDYTHGILMPLGITDELMASNVWVFQMRFKITTWNIENGGRGSRRLISLNRPGTGAPPFFELRANVLNQTRVQMELLMDDGDGTIIRQSFNQADLDEWIDMTFVIDFGRGSSTFYTDDFFQTNVFENFNFDNFRVVSGGVAAQPFYFGYYNDIHHHHGNNPDDMTGKKLTGELVIDELKIRNAELPSDLATFENALRQLTDHLDGAHTLTAEEISGYATDALTNYRGNYPSAKATVDAYFQAYEASYEPLFTDQSYRNFYGNHDEFGWVILNLQLDIMDNYVAADHIDLVDGLEFETHVSFPGPVADTATRVNDHTFLINGTYVADPGYNHKILDEDYGGFARRGTGYWAAPGEKVTIAVPDELVGIGAQVVLGSHMDDVRHKMYGLSRFPRVFAEFDIAANTIEAINPLGGAIYITIPEGSALGPVQVGISGAVQFAYFPMNSVNNGDADDLADFHARIASQEVLWGEVETDSFMFTATRTAFLTDRIVEVLETWDAMWEAYQAYNGRPFPLSKPEHAVYDRMSKWKTLAGGYPMVLQFSQVPHEGDFWYVYGYNMMNIFDYYLSSRLLAHDDHKVTYWHEMSHHTSLPTLRTERECIVGLAYVVAFHVGYGMDIDEAMAYSERARRDRDEAMIHWVIAENFRNNQEMTQQERQYQQRGWSKYVDIGVLFGWGFEGLGGINKVFYDEWAAVPGGQAADPDGFIITDSELLLASNQALGVNLAPLYHFWGEQPDPDIVDQLNSYPRSVKVYNRLREIRDKIPRSLEEYQPYYDDWPDAADYQNAYADWEGTRDEILSQIDYILELYYGSDFDQDGVNFRVDSDDTDAQQGSSMDDYLTWAEKWGIGAANLDDDNDGDTNLREFALSGNPIDSRVRAIAPEIFLENGKMKFRHLKRKNSANLSYRIKASESLSDESWTDTTLNVLDISSFNVDYDIITKEVPMDLGELYLQLAIPSP